MFIYNNHYVYIYLRENVKTPYYVGKGKNNRYKEEHNVNIPSNEENIIFVAKNLTNHEACILEKKLISYYGRKDLGTGILRNLTDGGDGGDTSKSKKYIYWIENVARNPESDYNKNISRRMKTNNPMFNPEIAKKSQTIEARKKRAESRRGKKMPESAKEKLRKIGMKESKERSVRLKNCWKNEEYRNNASNAFKKSISNVKNFTEEEFYKWIKNKKLFTKNGKNGDLRPNPRVKMIVDHFNKTEEFYGKYYEEKEQKRKKSWYYYKECPEEEFYEWIKKQSIYRKDGNPNPRILSVIRFRGLEKKFY